MSEAARSHQSDHRVEPYMEAPGGVRSDAGNPLAELARVVGQDDPFRNMFRPSKLAPPAPEAAETRHRQGELAYADDVAEPVHHVESREPDEDDRRPVLHPSLDGDDQHPQAYDEAHPDEEAEAWDNGAEPPHREPFAHDVRAEPLDHAEPLPVEAPHYVAPPLTPDLWAEGLDEAEVREPAAPALSDEAAAESRSPRRPLIVLAAVLVLTGGGLAATFLSRSSQTVAVNGGSAPTIMAASGPTKVKQADGPTEAAPVDADAALLSTKVGSSGPVRVVNSQEQPIDLAQLPKSASGSSETGSARSTPFPEPRKVKTFLVRPDGSLVNGTGAPARASMPQFAAAAGLGGDASDAAATPAARPSTPKSTNSASTTPKAPPQSIADLAAGGSDADHVAKQPASPGAKAASDGRPAETVEPTASEPAAATGPGGNFALQLAASPSEQDARAAFTKLQKKYAELGGYQPTVKKVDNGQKTVYRLRVSNLSQDKAKTLCSSLQASGGTCFVVHN